MARTGLGINTGEVRGERLEDRCEDTGAVGTVSSFEHTVHFTLQRRASAGVVENSCCSPLSHGTREWEQPLC